VTRQKPLSPEPKFVRGKGARRRKKRYLLLCEGKKTEQDYLKDVRRTLKNGLVEIVVDKKAGVSPRRLLDLAIKRKQEAERNARREGDPNARYDMVWCVFDTDDHREIPEVRRLAPAYGIRLAISNPCFELWVLLHYQHQRAYLNPKQAAAALKKHIADYDKGLDCSLFRAESGTAVERAKELARLAEENGDPFGNPTTAVWEIVAELETQSGSRYSTGLPK
jgi:hypothetical protein